MTPLDKGSASATPGKESVTLSTRASRLLATITVGGPSPSSDTNPTQFHFPAPASIGSALKEIASSGGAGSELGLGSLMNGMNGAPTNSAGVVTAFSLCR